MKAQKVWATDEYFIIVIHDTEKVEEPYSYYLGKDGCVNLMFIGASESLPKPELIANPYEAFFCDYAIPKYIKMEKLIQAFEEGDV